MKHPGPISPPRRLAPQVVNLRNPTTLAALALVLLAAPMPSTNALDVTPQAPLAALVTVELPEGARQPRTTVSPGWDCVVAVPWAPKGDLRVFELACTPATGTERVVEWRCQNPAVVVEATGLGSVTGTSYCDGVSASCTAAAPAPGRCHHVVFGTGAPPLRCRVETSGFIASWHVTCYNDP